MTRFIIRISSGGAGSPRSCPANSDTAAVRFLYGTPPGRLVLKGVMGCRLDRAAVAFLRSPWSRPLVRKYVRRYGIPLSQEETARFATFRDFFARSRPDRVTDPNPEHLTSPCDGWLSAFPVDEDSVFSIKNSRYRVTDLLGGETLGEEFRGGDCLIFRLTPSDYHRYCYFDDALRGPDHDIPGALHSVQPIACAYAPVYALNRRSWTLLETDHFGPAIQIEVGALIVGGIVNEPGHVRVRRGMEMGRFELSGSTIVLFFQRGRISLLPRLLREISSRGECRVEQGAWIGTARKV